MGLPRYHIETECINQLAVDGYDLSVNCSVSPSLRRLGVNLIDVRHVLARGKVVKSDMLEERGLWVVTGGLVDGGQLTVTVAVRSNEHDVEILEVT